MHALRLRSQLLKQEGHEGAYAHPQWQSTVHLVSKPDIMNDAWLGLTDPVKFNILLCLLFFDENLALINPQSNLQNMVFLVNFFHKVNLEWDSNACRIAPI